MIALVIPYRHAATVTTRAEFAGATTAPTLVGNGADVEGAAPWLLPGGTRHIVFDGDARIVDVTRPPASVSNIAANKAVVVSSIFSAEYPGGSANDGSLSTRWSSEFSDTQWIYVDLAETYSISQVVLRWETAFAADYQVQVSDDAAAWTTIRSVTDGDGGGDDLTGLSGSGRYLRIYGTRRGTRWGYSLWELEVYGTPAGPRHEARAPASDPASPP